ncbi:MAG: ABC transporter permease [Thermodesulfovibrionales bacterium]|nr:ABC transporter permease [Thermodesulfovibrionales bacterium]
MVPEKIKKLYKLLPPLVVRDIKEKYAGSSIGVFWTFIQPLLVILLFWLVFSKIMKIRIPAGTGDFPYLPFLLSGLLPWFALSDGITRGASSIVDRAYIIKKVYFPPELLTVSVVISSLIHHGVGFLIFLTAYFIITGSISMLQITFLIILLGVQFLLTVGLALILASLVVYIRDILQILGVVLQALFYLSTILYPISAVPETLRKIIVVNPFTALIEGYHQVILYGKAPELFHLISLGVAVAVSLFAGRMLFRRLKQGFADVL